MVTGDFLLTITSLPAIVIHSCNIFHKLLPRTSQTDLTRPKYQSDRDRWLPGLPAITCSTNLQLYLDGQILPQGTSSIASTPFWSVISMAPNPNLNSTWMEEVQSYSYMAHRHGFSTVCVSSYDLFCTLIWFISGVCLQLAYKMTILRDGFLTIATMIWFISSVYLRMYFKIIILWKILLTLAASIWFLSSMCS